MSIVKASSLDLSKVTFSDVKVDNHGRKMVYVNYNGGKVLVQTPKMYVPNGIKRWRKKDATDNKDDSFEMELSFGGEDKTDKNSVEIREFHNKMEQFDEMVKKRIMTHSKEWLGKSKISMESIEEAFYVPSVRVPVDKDGNVLEYPSRVRAKLDRERVNETDNFTGRFLSNKRLKSEVLIFDENKNQIPMNESNFDTVVSKGSQVVCLLELVYLSISTKVSAKWKLVQAKVFNNQQSIKGYAILDDDEQEADLDTENEEVEQETPEESQDVEETQEEADEDIEESQQEEHEQEVEVAAPTVKKTVRTKRGIAA